MKNKPGQPPQEVTRANVLQQLRFMATHESGYGELSLYNENTSSFLREVRKHHAKINNTLAYKWGMDESTIDMKEVKWILVAMLAYTYILNLK